MDVIKNKSYKNYDYFSRYTSFPYYYHTLDKKYIYGTSTQINKNSTYTLYKVEKNDTLDNIALKMYNNPTFYWAIASFNDVINPFEKLIEGTFLKIPTLSDISFEGD